MSGIRLVHSRDSLDALAQLGGNGLQVLHALIWHSVGQGSKRTAIVALRDLADSAKTTKDTAKARLDQLERMGVVERRRGSSHFEPTEYTIHLDRTGIEVAA